MNRSYDLVVIGSGPAGSVVASLCRAAGWGVAVIDHLPFGGTCPLRGCHPKKVLVGVAGAIDHTRRMRGKGVAGGEQRLDWRALMAFKRSFTDPVPAMKEKSFAEAGIDAYHGRARFRGPHSLAVEGEVLQGRFFVIAVGAVPTRLDIPGEEHLITSAEFLELDELPRRIAFLGGGYVAAEFAHVAARAGAQVTVLEQFERILMPFDPDLVRWLMERSSQLGIEVRTGRRVAAIEKRASGFTICASSKGQVEAFTADLVVHAAGRVPDIDSLDLETGGIAVEKGHLALNEFLQSVSNPAVYAAGDAAAKGPPLTPVATHDGKVVSANLLNGNRERPNYLGVPSVAFTIPPIAAVGLHEIAVREQGLKFRKQHQRASDWFTARQTAETTYGFKVLIEEQSNRILGAHLVGPHADEVINIFALALRNDLTAEDLTSAMFAYPTGGSDIGSML